MSITKRNISHVDDVTVLSPRARQRLLAEKDKLEKYVNHVHESKHEYTPKTANLTHAKNRIRHIENMIDRGTPSKPKGVASTKLIKRRDELKKIIADVRMEYGMTRDALRDRNNGAQLLKCQKIVNPLIKELREIEYTLDQDDPTKGNVEYLRRGGAEGRTTVPIPGMTR